MELQAIYERYLGEIGKYQAFIIGLTLFMRISHAFMVMDVVFFAATPSHWFKHPKYNNIVNLTDKDWKTMFIPKDAETSDFESCKMYSWAYNSNMTNEFINETLTLLEDTSTPISSEVENCDEWEYDTWTHVKSSLVSEWNMVCDRKWMKSTLSAMYAVGWIIGTQIGCYFSDRIGRHKVLLICAVGTVITELIQPFVRLYGVFVFIRFLMSAFYNAQAATLFTVCSESVGASYRTGLIQIYMVVWSISYAALAGIAYLLRGAFQFQLFVGIFSLTLLLPSWFMPESLEWYVAKGKKKATEARLRKMALWNNKTIPDDLEINVQQESTKTETRILDLITHTNMLRITIIISFNWFTVSVVYYAIAWNAADLNGNLYINVFLSGLVEIPAYLLNIPLLQKVGRRWGMILTTIIAGLAYIIALPLPALGSMILVLLSKFFISISFTIVYQYTAELYPTVIRAVALAVSLFSARVGTLVAPYLPLLGKVIPDVLCGVLCLVAGLSLLFLPETMNMPLRKSVAETEEQSKLKLREILRCPLFEKADDKNAEDTKPEDVPLTTSNNKSCDVDV